MHASECYINVNRYFILVLYSIPDTAAIDIWSFLLYSHSGHDAGQAVRRGVGVGAVAETGRGPRCSCCRRSIRQAMAVRRLHYAEHRGLCTTVTLVRH